VYEQFSRKHDQFEASGYVWKLAVAEVCDLGHYARARTHTYTHTSIYIIINS